MYFNISKFHIKLKSPTNAKDNTLHGLKTPVHTVYLRSLDQLYKETYYKKWVNTSWTYSMSCLTSRHYSLITVKV